MRHSFRVRVGLSAAALLFAAGIGAPAARAFDEAYYDQAPAPVDSTWYAPGSEEPETHYFADDESTLISIRVGAIVLHRGSTPTRPVMTSSGNGSTLLSSPSNDPWAAGTEVDMLLNFTESTAFEFDWFSIDDWFGYSSVSLDDTSVNQVSFPVTFASSSVSSRLRNLEFNLRQQVSDRFTLLAGVRYLEFLDHVGAHYQNFGKQATQDFTIETGNRMYGVQIGVDAKLWNTDVWHVDALVKVGMYGNLANNSSGVFSSGIVPQGANIRALDSHSVFAGDLAIRATRDIGKYVQLYAGYRLIYIDGLALAGDQFAFAQAFKTGDIPSIDMGGSLLLHGIEAGVTFKF